LTALAAAHSPPGSGRFLSQVVDSIHIPVGERLIACYGAQKSVERIS
jgi:hypothetical protein